MSDNQPWADKKLTDKQRADMAFRYLDWLLTKNVPSGGFRVLYAILQRLNEENQFHCFPSIEYLAARIKRAPSTVWEMLPKLEKIGVIEIEWGSQGSGDPNRYQLPATFLEFYFGPEKGRQPKFVLPPKKPRRAGVSKPRQTGVSDNPENPGSPSEKPRFTEKKPRPAGESHFLATDSHKKERGSAARTTRVDRDSASSSTSADAPTIQQPVARADALRETVPEQEQQSPVPSRHPPHRDNPDASIGTPANAANGARAAFEDVRFAWPSDRTDDEGYAAYVAALAAAQGDTEVVLDAIWDRLEESGMDPPWLSDALRRIEHDLRYGNPRGGRT